MARDDRQLRFAQPETTDANVVSVKPCTTCSGYAHGSEQCKTCSEKGREINTTPL